jgi:hypothetical protein
MARCLGFGFKRFALGLTWRRCSLYWALLLAKVSRIKSAGPAQYMAQHRQRAAVFPPTSRRMCTSAFAAARLVTNSTFTRPPRARTWSRQQSTYASASVARFRGLTLPELLKLTSFSRTSRTERHLVDSVLPLACAAARTLPRDQLSFCSDVCGSP